MFLIGYTGCALPVLNHNHKRGAPIVRENPEWFLETSETLLKLPLHRRQRRATIEMKQIANCFLVSFFCKLLPNFLA